MKKLLITLLAMVLAAGVLHGCGGGKPVEITVVSSYDATDGNRDNFVNAYRAYEQKTGNAVKDLNAKSSEDWKADVRKSFRDGNNNSGMFSFIKSPFHLPNHSVLV